MLFRSVLGAAAALLGMSVMFLAAIGSAWWRGLDIACGCFGKDEISTDFRTLILRDLALLAAVTVLFVHEWWRARALIIAAAASTFSASPAAAAPPDRAQDRPRDR